MPKMTILNQREIKKFNELPYFQSQDRKKFLTLPTKLQQQLSSFHTTTNKVCFHLTFAYFKACGRFFTPVRFRTRDIEFVCRRLSVFAFAVERSNYSRETFSRHKRLILAYFNYQPFDSNTHTSMLKKSVKVMIRSQFRPKLIFNFMVDLLCQKRTELPPYNMLHAIIVNAIGEYLIKDTIWKQDSVQLLKQTDLSHLNSIDDLLRSLKKKIEKAFHSTNQSILLGENKFMRFRDNGKFSVATPKVEEADAETIQGSITYFERWAKVQSKGQLHSLHVFL